MAVIFPILSTFDPKGVNAAQGAFKGLSTTAKVGTLAFAGLGAAAARFGIEVAKAAAADQKSSRVLEQQLKNTLGASQALTASVEDYISKTQMRVGVQDDELRPSFARLIRSTEDVAKAQELLNLALDIQIATGKPLESIVNSLGKGYDGNNAALGRLGLGIDQSILKSGDFNKVTKTLKTTFAGFADNEASTLEGKFRILGIALDETKESIGNLLIPVLTKMADTFLTSVMPAIERVTEGGLKALQKEIANSISGLTGMAAVIKDVVFALVGIKIASIALLVAPPIIAAITSSLTAMRIAALYGAAGFKVLGVAIQTSLASTGVGLLIVGLGLVIGKLIEMRLTAGETDKTVRFMESNGVQAFRNMGDAAYLANQKIAGNIITLNAVALAASRAADEVDNIGIKRVKQGRVPPVSVAVPETDLTSTSGKIAKVADAVKGLSDAAKVAQTQMAKLGDELTRNNDILNKAKDAYASFKSGIVSVITGIIDFGSAATAETGTFLENLIAQAAKAADFGSKVKQLLAMGLSETAIGQVLAAGADAGTKIADEIIAGGATVVDQVNTLISATQSVADAVGEAGATQFYQAGITAGQAMVEGVKAAIAAAGFSINVDGGLVNQGAINQVNAAIAAAKGKKSKGKTKITDKERKNIMDLAASLGVEVPAFAKGGIVTGPTLALIGEAGPEAVVPLTGRNGGMGTTINLTVNAGMGADGASIGREIVDIIKRYERVSGPVFASA